ncbi:hypothetical protein [Mesobacillus foraminis]|uniref:hypothetical protein n=1 Tax=Mesobacillus foraminis TaxID=279826 RepID=UPI000EF512CB|nr:hypothetical protein [Mesobacillus foraminis]
MSKADDIKSRMKNRDARGSLMGTPSIQTAEKKVDEKPQVAVKTDAGNTEATDTANKNDINNKNVNINNNDNKPIQNSPIDINEIIGRTKKSEKEMVGIYFEPEVRKALDKLKKLEGKGAKSTFVNDITKWALQQKGLL